MPKVVAEAGLVDQVDTKKNINPLHFYCHFFNANISTAITDLKKNLMYLSH